MRKRTQTTDLYSSFGGNFEVAHRESHMATNHHVAFLGIKAIVWLDNMVLSVKIASARAIEAQEEMERAYLLMCDAVDHIHAAAKGLSELRLAVYMPSEN